MFCVDVEVRRTESGYVIELYHSEWTPAEQAAFEDPGIEHAYTITIFGHDAADARAAMAGIIFEHEYMMPSRDALRNVRTDM